MSLTFLFRPIIEGMPHGTWRFYIIRDERELVATSEVFEGREAIIEAANTLIGDTTALRMPYEINYGLHSGKYLARIMNYSTGGFLAKVEMFQEPETVHFDVFTQR
jgi:hypothetical protein